MPDLNKKEKRQMQNRGVIVLDPGHGKNGNAHPGAVGVYEGTQNFILSNFLKDYLEEYGFSVILTRKTIDDDPSLRKRGYVAGENGAILFISIHSNAPGDPTNDRERELYPTHRGVEVYYSLSDVEGNIPLAKLLCDAASEVMRTKNRGIKTRLYPDTENIDYYGVLRNSAESGCKRAFIIEHGFHTNPEDSAFLQSDECLKRLAKREAEIINEYFE